MAWRRLAAVLLLASAAAAAVAQDPAPAYLPEERTLCYDCHHEQAYGSSPPVDTFVNLSPPEAAGAAIGVPFRYEVSVQNAWTADLTYVEPVLDLTRAPSLAFAAEADPLLLELAGTVTTDPLQATEAQAVSYPLSVPEGLTYLRIRLEPDDRDPVTGPDLALKVEAGGVSETFDGQRRGGVEELDFTHRSDFASLGYGNWTVSAVNVPVRTADLLNASLSKPEIPFRISVDGGATDTPERILGLPSRDVLSRGESRTATFQLVALGVPGAGETVGLSANAHVHYDHPPSANADDDEDLAKTHPERILVQPDGTGARLSTTFVAPSAPAVQNGATLATVGEAIGYASAFLMVASTTAGGMFGKASRRWANSLFGTARRRVAFHNFLSYGLILAAFGHTGLFLVEAAYGWAVGLLWGGLAALCMLGLGLTGALQVPIIRRWHYATWRWSHYGLAVATIVFTLAHMALDGTHFDGVQEWLGWRDPVAGALS